MHPTGRLLRVPCAFAILVAGAPAWQHSHVAGDRPHTHSHHDLATHAHDDHGIERPRPHLHVALFGIEFTLPIDSDDDDDDAGQSHATFLSAAPAGLDASLSFAHFAASAQPMVDLGELPQAAPTFRCKTAIAAPLCDTARHERSGVQLI
jgi:hypothetical protein